jgi:hypothetical protein
MPQRRQDRYRQLETRARRKVGGHVLHPDLCPKLTLHGVGFAIPPRGARIVPAFGPGGVTVSTAGLEGWPQARELLRLARLRRDETCQTYGPSPGASLDVDAQRDADFLLASFDLAARLLDRQYELTDHEKAELLAFRSDEMPAWIVQLVCWCAGLPAEEG